MHTPAPFTPFGRYFKNYFLIGLNPIVRFLILSDVIWRAGIGLLTPLFPIFVIQYIQGGNALVIGIATTVGLFTKALGQMVTASIIDKIPGEFDDFWFMAIGSIISLLSPLLYLVIHTPLELYFVSFIANASLAMTFPSFMAIFTRHADKGREATDWGVYFTLTDFAGAIPAAIGGAIAVMFGFPILIVASTALSFFSVFCFIPVYQKLRTDRKNKLA